MTLSEMPVEFFALFRADGHGDWRVIKSTLILDSLTGMWQLYYVRPRKAITGKTRAEAILKTGIAFPAARIFEFNAASVRESGYLFSADRIGSLLREVR